MAVYRKKSKLDFAGGDLVIDLSEVEARAVYLDYSNTFHQVSLTFVDQIRNSAQTILNGGADDNAVKTLVMQVALSTGFSKIMTEKIIALQGSDPADVLKAEEESDRSWGLID